MATVARLQSPGSGRESRRHLALDEHDGPRGRLRGLDETHQHQPGQLVGQIAGGEPARR